MAIDQHHVYGTMDIFGVQSSTRIAEKLAVEIIDREQNLVTLNRDHAELMLATGIAISVAIVVAT
jgi:hypothetical protein